TVPGYSPEITLMLRCARRGVPCGHDRPVGGGGGQRLSSRRLPFGCHASSVVLTLLYRRQSRSETGHKGRNRIHRTPGAQKSGTFLAFERSDNSLPDGDAFVVIPCS